MPTVFVRARWSVLAAGVLGVGSILQFPGGTPFQPTRSHFSLTMNFLSDLGMTNVYGRPNTLGALLFGFSLLLLLSGLTGVVVGFARLVSSVPGSRRYARTAGAMCAVSCAAFTGVAVTPENRVMELHVGFTLFAFRVLPLASLLLALASACAAKVPVRVTIAWAGLTGALGLYAGFLSWGPSTTTVHGRTVDVIAQKVITTIVVGTLLYINTATERLARTGVVRAPVVPS